MRDERGSATVLAGFAIVAILVVGLGILQFGSVVAARHRAQSAADLGALAAAGAVVEGDAAACAAAGVVATRMSVDVTACEVDGWDVVVTVSTHVDLAPFGRRTVAAIARAGPVEGAE